jgi:hypothetical protein
MNTRLGSGAKASARAMKRRAARTSSTQIANQIVKASSSPARPKLLRSA